MSHAALTSIDHAFDRLLEVHGFTDTGKRQLARLEARIMRDGPEGREAALAAKRQFQSAINSLSLVCQSIDRMVDLMPTPTKGASVHVIGGRQHLPGALDFAPDDGPEAA